MWNALGLTVANVCLLIIISNI